MPNRQPHSTYEFEKKSLEAHVEICAVRYSSLETKLENLDKRMDKLEVHIVDIKDSLGTASTDNNKTIIAIGTALFGVLLTGIIAMGIHLVTK